MSAFGSCLLEFRKNRRRPVFLLIAAVVGIDLAYLFAGVKRAESISLAQPWEPVLFYIPLLNTLFLSVLMAVFASRAMDLEHRGNTWNLLQTLQSRRSVFLGKTLYGLILTVVFSVVQAAAIVTCGKYYGFAGWPSLRGMALTVMGGIIGGMVIYQLQCLLSLIFPNQFAALSINLCGTLAGFFLMYVNDRPLTPWSLNGALRVLNVNFQEGDTAASYEWYSAPAFSWLIAALYFALFLALGLALYRRMEEGTLTGAGAAISKSRSVRTAAPVELIKLRRSPVWIAFFAIPVISALIGTINFVMNQGVLSFTWESLWTQQSLFLGMFFLPPLIGIFCSLLWRMEHTGANWNLVLTVEAPAKLMRDKLLTASGMSALCILWIGFLYVICGRIVGIYEALPAVFFECLLCGVFACMAISAVQSLLSLILHSFAIPVGMAMAGSIAGLFCVVKGWNYALPYAMLQMGLRSTDMKWEVDLRSFSAVSLLYTAVFYGIGVLYLRRSDVRTALH